MSSKYENREVKIAQHSVHHLLEDCSHNLDPERKISELVRLTLGVDTEQLKTFFLHLVSRKFLSGLLWIGWSGFMAYQPL